MMETEKAPVPIRTIGWFGIILACTYLVFGIVNIVLSILDRSYANFGDNLVIIIYGIPILAASIAFKNGKRQGWYGLMIIFALFVIMAIAHLNNVYNIAIGIISAALLIAMLTPRIKGYYS